MHTPHKRHMVPTVEGLEDRCVLSALLPTISLLPPIIPFSSDPSTPVFTSAPSAASPAPQVFLTQLNQFINNFINSLDSAFSLPAFFPTPAFSAAPTPSLTGFPAAPAATTTATPPSSTTGSGNQLSGFPVVNATQPVSTPLANQTTVNTVGPPTGQTETIGLLAFPIFPTLPLMTVSVVPHVGAELPEYRGPTHTKRRELLTDENFYFYWTPAQDAHVLPPDRVYEQMWEEGVVPGPATNVGPRALPPLELPPDLPPADDVPLPPADVLPSSAATRIEARVAAIQDIVKQANGPDVGDIVVREGWSFGLVAAAVAGTLAPELGRQASDDEQDIDGKKMSCC